MGWPGIQSGARNIPHGVSPSSTRYACGVPPRTMHRIAPQRVASNKRAWASICTRQLPSKRRLAGISRTTAPSHTNNAPGPRWWHGRSAAPHPYMPATASGARQRESEAAHLRRPTDRPTLQPAATPSTPHRKEAAGPELYENAGRERCTRASSAAATRNALGLPDPLEDQRAVGSTEAGSAPHQSTDRAVLAVQITLGSWLNRLIVGGTFWWCRASTVNTAFDAARHRSRWPVMTVWHLPPSYGHGRPALP